MVSRRKDEDIAPAVLSGSNIATAVIGLNGVFHYVNPAFTRLSGYLPEDLGDLRAECLFGDGTLPGRVEPDGVEHQMIRKDRSVVWVRAIPAALSSPITGHHGLILQLIDIERQKQAEAALLWNENRLNFALDAAGEGVWDIDMRSGEVYFSTTWRTMRGIPPGEIVDGSVEAWLERIHPDDRAAVIAGTKREGIEARGAFVVEFRERHRDGRLMWIQSRGKSVAWDEDGHPTRMLGTDTDITERKIADDEHRRLSRRLELALDASKVGVWEQNLATGKITWDRRMSEIYGRDGDTNPPDGYWESAVHPDDRDRAAWDLLDGIDGNDYSSEFRVVLPDGQIKYLRSRGQAFDDPDGSRKIIGAEWDVTADVRLNEELQQARALAESRYAELNSAQARIQHAALHDELTDLPNRRFLNQVLTERRAQAQDRGKNLAVLHIDLDWFKEINDRLGHAAGDAMLQHVGNLLRANVREGDFIARIGGDEFVMLCWFGGDLDELGGLAERIIDQLQEEVPYEGHMMRVGASIGIAYEKADGMVSRRLLRDADIALYRAKNLGRNRYEFAA